MFLFFGASRASCCVFCACVRPTHFLAMSCKVGDQRIPDADLTCPNKLISHLIKSELVVKMVESFESLDDVHGIYYGHLDKGDVQALESFILDPLKSSIEVRNEMISCIPYISDNAFKTAFTRTPSLNEWHLAQVLLMSSPLKQSVINMMSYYNLDPFYRELVLNGQGGGVTNMMIFEADMNLLSKTAETSFQDLAKLSVFNENDNAGYVDLFNYIGQYDAEQADFLQIPLFLTQKEFISASTVLSSCPLDDSYCDVLSIQALSLSTNQDCPKFSQQEVSQLQVLALDDTKPGNIFARDVLREVTDEEIEFELHFNSNSRSLMKEETPMVFSFLTAYPNPAQTVTYLTTEIPEGVEKVQIELIDAQGRIERSFYPLDRIGVIELNVSNLETGIYLCKLYFDGIHIESEKILVLH